MKREIVLSKEKKAKMIEEIKTYFSTERDEDLGDLAAMLILDFVIEKLGPEIYNQGVYDAHLYMNGAVEDLLGIQKY